MAEKRLINQQKAQLRELSIHEERMALAVLVLLLVGLFSHLGIHPLKHEEPRRALVALEMIFRGNWIVPTELGELYYNKPPLYNWLLITSFKIFGSYSEWAVRFFSVLSLLGMGGLIYLVGKEQLGKAFGVYSALFFLVCVEFIFYFSLTGEIDLFYSCITLAQLLAIFHFQGKQKYVKLFLSVYFLAALGTLTKGLPSVAFTGISLFTWLVYQREVKRLFSPSHFLGILLFICIVGSYFWVYSWYENPIPYLKRLFFESSSRTVVENGLFALAEHMFTFPLQTLINLMPASLLLIFALGRGTFSKIKNQPFILFCILIFATNILLYWFSPGARARYVYMLYPFPIMIMVYGFLRQEGSATFRKTLFERLLLFLILVLFASGPVILLVPQLGQTLDHVYIPAIVASLGGMIALYIHLKFPSLRVLNLILLIVWARIVFNFTVIPIRDQSSRAAQDELDATLIHQITQEAPLHVLEGSMISRSTVFYLERSRERVLGFDDSVDSTAYYMAYEEADLLKGLDYDILYTFKYHEKTVFLLKVK